MSLRGRLFATIVGAVLVSTVLTVVVSEVLLRHRAESQARNPKIASDEEFPSTSGECLALLYCRVAILHALPPNKR